MPDLYETLGVSKSVKAHALKRAYRNRCRETHPDCQGDQAEFEAVKLAYEVLSDPDRRAHYDATGDFEAKKPDNAAAQSMCILAQVFGSVVSALLTANRDPKKEDMVALMKTALNKGIGELEQKRQMMGTAKTTLDALGDRFSAAEGENFLDGLVRSQQVVCAKNIETMESDLVKHKAAAELLKRFKFRSDRESYGPTGTTSVSPMFFAGYSS